MRVKYFFYKEFIANCLELEENMLQLVEEYDIENEVRKAVGEDLPEPPGFSLGSSSCLICLSTEVCEVNLFSNPSSEEEACLKKQLVPIFILRKLLLFPRQECGKLLKTYVLNPGEWCRTCLGCAELVELAFQLTQQISVLEKNLEAVGAQVRNKLKDSFTAEYLMGGTNVHEDGAVNIGNVIRDYFRGLELSSSNLAEDLEVSEVKYVDSWNGSGLYEDSYIISGLDDDIMPPRPEEVEEKYTKYNFRRTRKVGEYRKYGKLGIKEDEKKNKSKTTTDNRKSSKFVRNKVEKEFKSTSKRSKNENKTASTKNLKSPKVISKTVKKEQSSEPISKLPTSKRRSKISIKTKDTKSDTDLLVENSTPNSKTVKVEKPPLKSYPKKGTKRKLGLARKSTSSLAKRLKTSHSPSKTAKRKSTRKAGRPLNPNPRVPFCNKCNFLFKHRGSFHRHMQTHKITDLFDDTETTSKFRVKCKLCGHEGRRLYMYMHVRSQHGDVVGMSTVQCHMCDRQFSCTGMLTVHIKSKHTSEDNQPEKTEASDGGVNPESVAGVENFVKIKDGVNGEAPTTMTTSNFGASAADKALKRAHTRLNKKKKSEIRQKKQPRYPPGFVYTCDRCDFKSVHRASYGKHKDQHKITDLFDETSYKETGKVKCKICDEEGLRVKMYKHIRQNHSNITGLGLVMCHLCDKMFARKNTLTAHIRDVHEKERRHKCTLCEASFMKRTAYEDHYAKHLSNGQNTIICELCGMCFATRPILRGHKKKFHQNNQAWDPGSEDLTIECRYCGVKVINNGMLRCHMKVTHPEIYRYKCEQCDATYTDSKGLNTHVKTKHSGSIECQYCGAILSCIDYLKTHLKSWCKRYPGSSAVDVKHEVEVEVDIIPESSVIPTQVTYLTEQITIISEDGEIIPQQVTIIQHDGLNYTL